MTNNHIHGTSPGETPGGWYFHSDVVNTLMAADQAGQSTVVLSLDLGVSQKRWSIRNHALILGAGGEGEILLPLERLAPVSGSKNRVFYFDGSALSPVEVRADGYYKLVPTDSLATLEINGVKMHRSKDIDPVDDARGKTALAVGPKDIVLDTCGGLGYSAVFAVKAGASRVISTEKSRAVLSLRAMNPWTRPGAFPWLDQAALDRIHLEHADISRRIGEFAAESFNAVIHDPPRFTSATGDLYGKEFYGHLARVLRPGGRLFHYTGSPMRIKNGNRFVANAQKRLAAAGFDHIAFNDALQGLTAEKAGGQGRRQ